MRSFGGMPQLPKLSMGNSRGRNRGPPPEPATYEKTTTRAVIDEASPPSPNVLRSVPYVSDNDDDDDSSDNESSSDNNGGGESEWPRKPHDCGDDMVGDDGTEDDVGSNGAHREGESVKVGHSVAGVKSSEQGSAVVLSSAVSLAAQVSPGLGREGDADGARLGGPAGTDARQARVDLETSQDGMDANAATSAGVIQGGSSEGGSSELAEMVAVVDDCGGSDLGMYNEEEGEGQGPPSVTSNAVPSAPSSIVSSSRALTCLKWGQVGANTIFPLKFLLFQKWGSFLLKRPLVLLDADQNHVCHTWWRGRSGSLVGCGALGRRCGCGGRGSLSSRKDSRSSTLTSRTQPCPDKFQVARARPSHPDLPGSGGQMKLRRTSLIFVVQP